MPAETHQRCESIGVEDVAGLLAWVVGLDAGQAADVPLGDLHLDDDLSILHLWDVVVEEFGERSIGDLDLDLDETRPCTLGELAEIFTRELVP